MLVSSMFGVNHGVLLKTVLHLIMLIIIIIVIFLHATLRIIAFKDNIHTVLCLFALTPTTFSTCSQKKETAFPASDHNVMFAMDCFNVICCGNPLLRGLCVRDGKCPRGNTAKYHILVSFSINFMALFSFLVHPPKRLRKWGNTLQQH